MLLAGCAGTTRTVNEPVFIKPDVPQSLLACASMPSYPVETTQDAASFIVDLGEAYGKTCENLKAIERIVK